MKRFDLMMGINTRGTFMVSKYCIPHLKKAENPHILMLSPPLDMKPKWFEHSTAYTMAKFGMSMCVLGPVRRIEGRRHRRQRAVAAHDDRDRRGRQSARRRRHDPHEPHAGDHGRCRACHLHKAVARVHRAISASTTRCCTPAASPISSTTASIRSVPLMSDFFVPDDDVPPPGVTVKPLPSVGAAQKSR